MIKDFEELIIWKDARKLANLVHFTFIEVQDYGFRNQINNAAVSVMNNTAEGFERFSNADFKRFLQISKASASEVRSMSYFAEDFNYTNELKAQEIRTLCNKIKAEIIKLMNTL